MVMMWVGGLTMEYSVMPTCDQNMAGPRKGESREEYLARRREEGRQIYANMTPEQKERRREQMKQYHQKNKESIAEKKKQYRSNMSPEQKKHIAEQMKQYNQNNPEVCMLSHYRYEDAKRGRANDLTEEFVRENMYQPCHYCGGMADVGYNGLDRMDSNLGHLQSNCVPCCPTCNKQKGTKSYKDFIAMRRG